MPNYQSKHTGKTIDEAIDQVSNKVDKIDGKDLSSNDFTDDEKEKLSRVNSLITFPLSNDGWEYFSDNIYSQTVSIEEIKSTDAVVADIILSDDEDLSQKEIECWSNISKIEVNDGNVKAYCRGEIPSISIYVRIKI